MKTTFAAVVLSAIFGCGIAPQAFAKGVPATEKVEAVSKPVVSATTLDRASPVKAPRIRVAPGSCPSGSCAEDDFLGLG